MKDIIIFVLGLGVMFLIASLISLYDYVNKLKHIKKRINESYGKDIDIDDVNIKMNSVSSYFRNKNKNKCIDDITWNDLSMDEVFKKINNTQSSAGSEVLYDMLRNPLYKYSELIKRDKIIEYFRKNEKERKEIQYILGKLGKSNDLYTTNCLFNEKNISKSKLLEYTILSYIPIVSLILVFINGYFIVLFFASIALNIYISQNSKKYNYDTDGFSYIISTVNTANKINNLKVNNINRNLEQIEHHLSEVKNIKKRYIKTSSNSVISELDIFSEYIDLMFLNDLKNYEKVKNTVIKKSDSFKAIYKYIGTIDALIGVASFRDSLKYYTTPNFIQSSCKDENILNFKEIYHPLIKNPVTNNGDFKQGILLTGSNASGKSTFIKTVTNSL